MNTKEKYKPSDLTRAYLDTLKEIKEPLQKMVKVGDLAPMVARIGVLRGYELGKKAGRKDMAKELKKELKKKIPVTKHQIDRDTKYNKGEYRDAYEGMIDGLEWALKHLGEDEDDIEQR